jgi:hypothetical protein
MVLTDKWRDMLGINTCLGYHRTDSLKPDFTYKGTVIPHVLDHPPVPEGEDPTRHKFYQFLTSYDYANRLSDASRYKTIPAGILARSLFVYDYEYKFTANHKKKMRKYAEEHGINVDYFVMCLVKPTDLTWIEDKRLVSYDVIREIRLNTNMPNPHANRVPGTFNAMIDGKYHENVSPDDFPSSNLFYFVINGRHFPKDMEYTFERMMQTEYPGCTIVEMPVNREAKFLRGFPHAKTVTEALREKYEQVAKEVGNDIILAQAAQSRYGTSIYKKMDPLKFKDPEIIRYLELMCMDTEPAKKLTKFNRVVRYLGVEKTMPEIENPFKDYPLFDGNYQFASYPDHCYAYMNATYRFVKKARTARRRKNKRKN